MKKLPLLILVIIFIACSRSNSENLSAEQKEKLNETASHLVMNTYLKKYDKAIDECKVIYEIDKFTGAIDYAETYRLMGNFKEAIKWAQIALKNAKETSKNTEVPLLILGSSYLLSGDNSNAEIILKEIVDEYPSSPNGYRAFAQYYEKSGNAEKAIYYWKENIKRLKDEKSRSITQEKIKTLEASFKQK